MLFRRHQEAADHRSLQLYGWFALMLLGLVLAVNGLLAGLWRLTSPFGEGYPALFFETNTAVVALFVLGGCFFETRRLREGGGPRVAHWLGGRELTEPEDALQRRLLNVVDEMALASGQPLPRVYLLPREDSLNAFVAGWDAGDTALCVTRGALERLDRAELQGLVAHEFGHIRAGDLPLSMRLLALVWGLSLVHGFGRSLMDTGEDGRVSPLAWMVGALLAIVGWLGWLAGRALQAAVSRQREFHADASAVQFTRSRDGIGQVLRKVWHDQQAHAARLHHPAAELVASMLMHQPAGGCLATHPRLSERIRRLHGRILPPMPATAVRAEAEPRRMRATAHTAGAMMAAAPGSPAPADVHGLALATPDDRDALDRLRRLSGPTEQRLAVLALMMDPANAREHKLWRQQAEGLPHAERILQDVMALQPPRRVPEFERLTAQMARDPITQRRAVVEAGRDLLRADGRVSPRDRLWWLSLRHRLNDAQREAPMLRPVTGQGQDLSELPPDALQAVAALSAYLARMLPEPETVPAGGEASRPLRAAAAEAWLSGIGRRTGLPDITVTPPPDADGLMLALTTVQELSWMLRPLLVKGWVEEAVNHSPNGVMSDDTADALRLVAGLIDAPLPPMLSAHYPRA
jgi:Zn-dependent protease with chaperone function